jgi:hypothetical protein
MFAFLRGTRIGQLILTVIILSIAAFLIFFAATHALGDYARALFGREWRDYRLAARPCIARRNSCKSASCCSISRSLPSCLAIVRCCCCTSFRSIGVSSS